MVNYEWVFLIKIEGRNIRHKHLSVILYMKNKKWKRKT